MGPTSVKGMFPALRWLGLLLLIPWCNEAAALQTGISYIVQSRDAPPTASPSVQLPLNVERDVRDLDEMVKRGTIRALVVLDPISFFYDSGLPNGVMYEALKAFERFANEKLKTRKQTIEVTFLPVRIDQLG